MNERIKPPSSLDKEMMRLAEGRVWPEPDWSNIDEFCIKCAEEETIDFPNDGVMDSLGGEWLVEDQDISYLDIYGAIDKATRESFSERLRSGLGDLKGDVRQHAGALIMVICSFSSMAINIDSFLKIKSIDEQINTSPVRTLALQPAVTPQVVVQPGPGEWVVRTVKDNFLQISQNFSRVDPLGLRQ